MVVLFLMLHFWSNQQRGSSYSMKLFPKRGSRVTTRQSGDKIPLLTFLRTRSRPGTSNALQVLTSCFVAHCQGTQGSGFPVLASVITFRKALWQARPYEKFLLALISRMALRTPHLALSTDAGIFLVRRVPPSGSLATSAFQ